MAYENKPTNHSLSFKNVILMVTVNSLLDLTLFTHKKKFTKKFQIALKLVYIRARRGRRFGLIHLNLKPTPS